MCPESCQESYGAVGGRRRAHTRVVLDLRVLAQNPVVRLFMILTVIVIPLNFVIPVTMVVLGSLRLVEPSWHDVLVTSSPVVAVNILILAAWTRILVPFSRVGTTCHRCSRDVCAKDRVSKESRPRSSRQR